MLFLLFFYKAYGLWRPERQLGRPFFELFLSEAGSEKAFRTQRGPSDDFVPCWSKRGAYPLLLEPGGS